MVCNVPPCQGRCLSRRSGAYHAAAWLSGPVPPYIMLPMCQPPHTAGLLITRVLRRILEAEMLANYRVSQT